MRLRLVINRLSLRIVRSILKRIKLDDRNNVTLLADIVGKGLASIYGYYRGYEEYEDMTELDLDYNEANFRIKLSVVDSENYV